MKFSASFSRSVGMVLALAFLGGAAVCGQMVMMRTAAPDKSSGTSKVTLSPEVEAKLKSDRAVIHANVDSKLDASRKAACVKAEMTE